MDFSKKCKTPVSCAGRDPRIELFRCCMMFGICLLHALDQGGYADSHRGLDNLMTPCVDGFVFISGYYGIKLKLKGVLKLLGIGAYCALFVGVVYHWLYLSAPVKDIATGIWRCFKEPWFLWTYLALMLCAPLLESVFQETAKDKWSVMRKVAPILFMVFAWSYAATKIPVLKKFTPCVSDFGGFALLTFAGIYLAAGTCRYYEVDKKVTTTALLALATLSGAFCWFNFMHYHSPFALIFSGALFFLFRRMKLANDGIIARTAVWLGPSMFSVYLLHFNDMGMSFLHCFEDKYIAVWGYYPVCFAVAIALFVFGVVADGVRRVAVGGSGREKR